MTSLLFLYWLITTVAADFIISLFSPSVRTVVWYEQLMRMSHDQVKQICWAQHHKSKLRYRISCQPRWFSNSNTYFPHNLLSPGALLSFIFYPKMELRSFILSSHNFFFSSCESSSCSFSQAGSSWERFPHDCWLTKDLWWTKGLKPGMAMWTKGLKLPMDRDLLVWSGQPGIREWKAKE